VSRMLATYHFVHLHFLHSSALDRYRARESESWALVTGASDGIGKGFAFELCQRGFNVVLHGRNETKLKSVREDLLRHGPDRGVRSLVIDAGRDAGNLEVLKAAATQLEDISLTILVNNVGGAGNAKPLIAPYQHTYEDLNRAQIDLNVRFQSELTRLLLPQLISNQPACVLNVGSASSDLSCCYLPVASGVKAYQKKRGRDLCVSR